jgi:hypothetical protein
MRFNVNHNVKVKLTDAGRRAHRKNHDDLLAKWPTDEKPEYRPPEEDAEGWSTWQLWRLMQEFGPHLYNGCDVPFETELKILET